MTTHDLPTIAGLWRRLDGDALLQQRLLDLVGSPTPAGVADVVVRAYGALAEAPSVLKLATLEDLCLAEQRPNVPGTTVERPNWRLPLPHSLEEIERSPVAGQVAARLSRHG